MLYLVAEHGLHLATGIGLVVFLSKAFGSRIRHGNVKEDVNSDQIHE